jgi:hypothetical protein
MAVSYDRDCGGQITAQFGKRIVASNPIPQGYVCGVRVDWEVVPAIEHLHKQGRAANSALVVLFRVITA